MENPKQEIVERVKQANNVLVTVSANPSVDQLAAAIGLTLFLNKLGKHATAVFSGQVPSTIEFLEPEKTLEKNTDSLRDFIIALDKSKADKLRYKVEENVVKIFITPYRTSISEKDLEFSQGDFNVDVVLALGVRQQAELDQAITAHGRILHDATVASINNGPGGELGSLHWQDAAASSLSEMVVSLGDELGKDLFDGQIATALLTGIVAETNRFSNDKTTPVTMSISSELMAAGANQQLVATKLQAPPATEPSHGNDDNNHDGEPPTTPAQNAPPSEPPKPDPGTLEIDHGAKPPEPSEPDLAQIHVDEEGTLHTLDDTSRPPLPQNSDQTAVTADASGERPPLITTPPSLGGTLTANSRPDDVLEPSTDALSLPPVDTPLLSRELGNTVSPGGSEPPATAQLDGKDKETLSEIESDVKSPHIAESIVSPDAPVPPPSVGGGLNQARDAVQAAIAADPGTAGQPLQPIAALNAQPVFDNLHNAEPLPGAIPNSAPAVEPHEPLQTLNMPLPAPPQYPANIVPPASEVQTPATNAPMPPSPPPPVPPPMMPFPPGPQP